MYHHYFGLSESPFSISVNPRYLFMSPRHRDALAHLLYGVGSGGGFILLTGEVGTGKTTINRALLEQMPETTDLAIVLNPALSAVELLATVCDEFDIAYPQHTDSLKILTDALHRFLLANHEAGRKSVLMIDEAQHLDFDVLEQIRLLTNLETDSEKLLQIILIGQPELTEKLLRPELRQLNQRITARYNLEPLNVAETAAYIRHRLEVAGLPGGRELFPASVVREIHRRTRGIPRQINLLCDRTLLGAYGRKQNKVSRKLVKSAAAEVFGIRETRRRRPWILAATGVLTLALVGGLLWVLVGGVTGQNETESTPTATDAYAATGAVGATAAQTSRSGTPAEWLVPATDAMRWLWQLNSDAPMPTKLSASAESRECSGEPAAGLSCVAAVTDVWNPVMALKRPVVLDMQTPDRFRAATLVVAFEDRAAWVLTEGGPELVLLVDLAQAWRGSYRYLWRPPEGWQTPLARGDTGPVVRAVAQMFASLDQQDQPLTREQFSEALETRVKLFQGAEGIEADGVVGEQTLMRMNDRLGLTPAPAQMLERAQLLQRPETSGDL